MNVFLQGLRAQELTLSSGEDAATFRALVAQLHRGLCPEDDTEAELVDGLAAAMRKEIRADRLESELLESLVGQDEWPSHGGDKAAAAGNRASLRTLIRYQAAASNAS